MISFIIPAYNAEKTIERAVKSILGQKNTNLDYEIIIVNDGSSDNTENVIKKIINVEAKIDANAQKDNVNLNEMVKNIIYVNKENGGLSDARNVGIQKSKGDYIIFVDSDDYISEYLLHDIEEYINKDIDLIKWNPVYVNENGDIVGKEECYPFDNKNGVEGFNYLYGKDKLISSAWNYAIKRYLVPKFPEGRYHEDFATMPIVVLKAKTMASLDKNEYYYVLSSESIMRSKNEEKQRKKLEDVLVNYDELIEKAKNLNLNKYTMENFMIFLTNSLLAILPEQEGENKQYFESELKKRKIAKNIKIRNGKQLVKKVILKLKGF